MALAHRPKLGDKVRIKNTRLYNGRVGILRSNSGAADDFWDYTVYLESSPVPEGTRVSLRKLYSERLIGVDASQIDAV